MLPRVKITDVMMEVEKMTGFIKHFTHESTGKRVKEGSTSLLLTTLLADGINMGLSKMAESCPGSTVTKLGNMQRWYLRSETFHKAYGELALAQSRLPLAQHWGEGKTSSSDGQHFKTGYKAKPASHVNLHYGSDPGIILYTHTNDLYSPFGVLTISNIARESTFVLDNLLHHEPDIKIEEHYTDTAGFTFHVFASCHLLGFRFAPRIRNLHDHKLSIVKSPNRYPALKSIIGKSLDVKYIRMHWDEIMRLMTSIKKGTVKPSLVLKRLSNFPRQSGLAKALRDIGALPDFPWVLSLLLLKA
jgi:TnpA family transposase